MREIGLGKGGACLYRDNEERIDPDRDFSHIDKRIQDLLGQYQKDFMGEVSSDNLGARWGGYGSFLPVTRCSSIPIITRPPPTHISSRSPHNSATEARQNLTIQGDESTNIRPRPGIPPSNRQSTSTSENAIDVRSSGDAFLKNQHKAVAVDLSHNNNVSKLINDNAVDNSAIYSGLGLDMSPSSSFEDSPLNIDGTPPRSQGLPETSPSHIIKVMTSLPVPGGKWMSPLSERFVSLAKREFRRDRNSPLVETSLQTEQELISSEGKMTVLKERKLKQTNRSKVSEFEGRISEDLPGCTGLPSRMEGSKISKGKEIVTEHPVDTNITDLDKKATPSFMEKNSVSRSSYPFSQRNEAKNKSQKQPCVREEPLPEQIEPASPVNTDFMHSDKKGTTTLKEKDNISRASYPLSKRIGVAKFVDCGAKYQKQSIVKEEPPSEQVNSSALPVAHFEEKEISAGFSEKIQRDMNATAVIKTDVRNGNVSQTKHVNQNSKKSREPQTEVKEELPEPTSSQGIGLQQKKMKNKTKMLPDSPFQNADAFHERLTDISMEKIHNERKRSSIASIAEKDLVDKKQLRNEEFRAKEELLEESSSAKIMPQSQTRANSKSKKERLSSENKKKIRKSQEGNQASVVLPKVSFKVGSSAAFSQQTDCGSDELRKVTDRNSDVTSNATPKKKEKLTATKDPIIPVAKREKHALGSQVKDNKSDSSQYQYQYPSNSGLVLRADPIDNAYSVEKGPSSGAVPTETATVVIAEDWVLCDNCQKWRLLPHDIKPDDLPSKWLCNMLTWLPGMNKCNFSEAETTEALRALYQPPPAVNNAHIPQTYPNNALPVAAADKLPIGMTMPVSGSDHVPDTLKRGAKPVESKMDQLHAVESGKKRKPIPLRSDPGKLVVAGKKREGSKDTHGALKKVKREPQQFSKDRINDDDSSQVPKDLIMDRPNNYSKKHKEKAQRTVTTEDERKDVSARKRKSRDGTEIPSSEAPSNERGNDLRREKKQKLDTNFQEKESSTTRLNDKKDRNTSHKTVEGRKLSRSDPELRMPALAAATSSSSKISSSCRVKVKSQAKCSPVGSISSSPMRVSRSNHDRSRDQISTPPGKQEFSMTKNKNLEQRIAASTEKKSDKSKEEDNYSRRKSVNVMGLDKTISDNLLPERFRHKQDQPGSSRDHPSTSGQALDFSKIAGFNATSSHDDSKGKPPSQQGFGKDDVRPSTSARKDNSDRAARTALKEAKDLKHSANRLLKVNGSGLSTEVFFQAALKFLNGASLLEFDNAEGSGSSDMKPSEVYRSTAKLCFYCAREFEKLNDMASAALAYKCMEVAYMRVVYYSDVVASRDRHELQLAQTEVPQESPSSSASDVDNVNNPTPNGVVVKATQSSAAHGNYVIAAGNRPSFDRLLNFTEDVNLAMDAARRSQNAFAVARSTLTEAGNEGGITAIKRVLDFSFHDVDELLHLVRLAVEAIPH